MSGQEIVELCSGTRSTSGPRSRRSIPFPSRAPEGVYFWTPEGKRYLDFNSQLMCTNIGHGHPAVMRAIQEQAATLAYANPFMATEARARLGAKLAEITPGDIDCFFFTNGGAEANENAIRIARAVTGRPKILARYRSYHGGDGGSDLAHRRSAALGGRAGHPRHRARARVPRVGHKEPSPSTRPAPSSRTSSYEGAQTIAAFIIEPVVGTNGMLDPARRLHAGRARALRQARHPADRRRGDAGFGRTGRWFAVDHWDVVPDLITMAKGLTSPTCSSARWACGRRSPSRSRTNVFPGGLTYNSHPLGCAAALATIAVYEDEGLDRERAARWARCCASGIARSAARHPSVGATRNDRPVRHGRAGAQPREATSRWRRSTARRARWRRSARSSARRGCTRSCDGTRSSRTRRSSSREAELDEGFAIIDRALEITDAAVSRQLASNPWARRWDSDSEQDAALSARRTSSHALDRRQAVRRTGERWGDVFDPARVSGRGAVPFADAAVVDAAVTAAAPAARVVGQARRSRRARASCSRSASCSNGGSATMAEILTSEHGKVLPDALGEVNRGLEVVEFACGLAAAHEGRVLRERLVGRRQLLDPPAARRRRRHHAVQLPGDGADVDVSRSPSRAATRSS